MKKSELLQILTSLSCKEGKDLQKGLKTLLEQLSSSPSREGGICIPEGIIPSGIPEGVYIVTPSGVRGYPLKIGDAPARIYFEGAKKVSSEVKKKAFKTFEEALKAKAGKAA